MNASLSQLGVRGAALEVYRQQSAGIIAPNGEMHRMGQLLGEHIRHSAENAEDTPVQHIRYRIREAWDVASELDAKYNLWPYGLLHGAVWHLVGMNLNYFQDVHIGIICWHGANWSGTPQCSHGIGHGLWIRARAREAYSTCFESRNLNGVVSEAVLTRGLTEMMESAQQPAPPGLHQAVFGGMVDGFWHAFYEHLDMPLFRRTLAPKFHWMDACILATQVRVVGEYVVRQCLEYLFQVALYQGGSDAAMRSMTKWRIDLLVEHYSGHLADACLDAPSELLVHVCIHAMSRGLYASYINAERAGDPTERLRACHSPQRLMGKNDYHVLACDLVVLHMTRSDLLAHADVQRRWCAHFGVDDERLDSQARQRRWLACVSGTTGDAAARPLKHALTPTL